MRVQGNFTLNFHWVLFLEFLRAPGRTWPFLLGPDYRSAPYTESSDSILLFFNFIYFSVLSSTFMKPNFFHDITSFFFFFSPLAQPSPVLIISFFKEKNVLPLFCSLLYLLPRLSLPLVSLCFRGWLGPGSLCPSKQQLPLLQSRAFCDCHEMGGSGQQVLPWSLLTLPGLSKAQTRQISARWVRFCTVQGHAMQRGVRFTSWLLPSRWPLLIVSSVHIQISAHSLSHAHKIFLNWCLWA